MPETARQPAVDRPGARPPSHLPLALLIVAAPLALGGTRPAIQVVLAGLAALAALWATRRQPRPPICLLIPLAIAGWGLVQCVPLPPALRPWAGWQSGWAPLSLNVPATVIATLHQAAFALVAIAAWGAGRRGRRDLVQALIRGAGLVAALGLVHWAAGAQQIFGLIAPLDRPALAGYFSVFVNPNTLAGYLVLGAAVALGRFADTRGDAGRRRAAALGALAAGGVVLSGSRGGQAALVLATLAFGALAFTHRGRVGEESARRARGVATGATIATLAAITAAVLMLPDWGADPRLDGRLSTWRACLPLLADIWPAGIGRGAFATVFPLAQQVPLDGTATHPESIVLQLAVEWGAPAALAALGAGLGGWWIAARRARRQFEPLRWGLVAGLAAVGAQQLVDFGFEAMGLSLPIAAALGLALGPARAVEAPEVRASRIGSLAAIGCLLMAVVGGLWAVEHQADADTRRISDAADAPAVAAAADHALRHHPTDGLAPLAAAARLDALGAPPDATLRRLDDAMRRAPMDHRAHLLAARVLRRDQPARAATEYRLAIERAPWRALPLVREAATLSDPLDLSQAVPPDQRRRLGEVLLEAARAADARAVMDIVLLVEPADPDARRIRGRACLRLADRACVEADARALLTAGHGAAGHGLLARLAMAADDPEAAAAAADAALRSAPDDPAAHRLAAQVAGARGDLAQARTHYGALFRRVGAEPAQAAAVLAEWGRLERRSGDPARGRRMLEQAAGLDPRFAAEAAAAERDPPPEPSPGG